MHSHLNQPGLGETGTDHFGLVPEPLFGPAQVGSQMHNAWAACASQFHPFQVFSDPLVGGVGGQPLQVDALASATAR